MSLNSNTTGLEEILASVNALPEAGGEPTLQEKTVSPTTAQQQVTPDSGFDGLSKVTVNAMPTAEQATPSISVSSAGLITASATQTAGYVSAGTKSATKQLTTQAAKTITPTTSSQTAVASGRYTTGAVTVAGDANLVAGNIKSGVSIFGVAGNYEGSGGGGSATVEILPITVTNNGMYEPGTNEYVLSNDNLHSSSRLIIMVKSVVNNLTVIELNLFRENLSNSFTVSKGANGTLSISNLVVNENSISVLGSLKTADYSFFVI